MSRHRWTRSSAILFGVAVCHALLSLSVLSGAVAATNSDRLDKLELVELLKDGQYDELNDRLKSVQDRYEAAKTDDQTVNVAFGAFAHADPALERSLDFWVELHPKVFMPYLARAAYHAHIGSVYRGEDVARDTDRHRFTMMRRHFDRALADLQKAVAMNKRLPTAYATTIMVHAIGGRFKDALDAFGVAQAELPRGTYHLLLLAHFSSSSWTGIGKSRKALFSAVSDWRQIDRRYEILDGYEDYAAATSLRSRREHDRAAEFYDRAIAANDKVSWYYFGRGRNQWFRDRDDAALKDLSRALELEHQSPRILELMARIYSRQKNHERALKHIGQAIALDPYNPRYLVARIQILRYMQRFERAANDIDTALFYGKHDADVHAERARYFSDVERDPAKAKSAWRRATELAPYSSEHWKSYLFALTQDKDCGAVGTAVKYLRICRRQGSCKRGEIMWLSYLLNSTIHDSQCPYEEHYVAKQFRDQLTPKDRKQVDDAKNHAAYPREKPFVGRSDARSMTLEGLKLGMTEAEVRRVFPTIEINRTFLRKPKVLFMAVGTVKSRDGKRDVHVVFSHFGTVHTVHTVGDVVVEATPSEINGKIAALRDRLKKPYGKPDKETTNQVNGKYLIEFRQTNDKLERVAGFVIEHHPARILSKEGDTVHYAFKVHRMLIDDELMARSKNTVDRLAAANRKR